MPKKVRLIPLSLLREPSLIVALQDTWLECSANIGRDLTMCWANAWRGNSPPASLCDMALRHIQLARSQLAVISELYDIPVIE